MKPLFLQKHLFVEIMIKKIFIVVILFFSQVTSAQCAMCRAVVEQGGEKMAEGINSGIVYLMAFPYLILIVAVYLFYRNWKKNNT